MLKPIRNRIVEHVQVRAGDLVPHPHNYRRHTSDQRRALAASYDEVGFARSLLGYRRSDGRIQLIDGHLRRDLEPNMMVTVEVLDVSEVEARKLLLTIDPVAALAGKDAEVLAKLRDVTRADSTVLNDLWQSLAKADADANHAREPEPRFEQFFILVECRDEAHQVELLTKFETEGLRCKPLLS
jgi:hypothetical protein